MKYEQFAANARKTYGDVCEIGGTLSHVKSVLAAVPDLIGKNERLEKENRELKGENARLKADYETALEHEDRLREDLADKEAFIEVLKAKLANSDDNIEGFQPDAYMKLPLDADGEPIRIGDTVYTRDAKEYIVRGIYALADEYSISVVPLNSGTCFLPMEPEGLMHRTTDSADSWEKLEADMMKPTSCLYFDIDSDPLIRDCKVCPHGEKQSGNPCWRNKHLDMLKRAKKLAGIEEEAER